MLLARVILGRDGDNDRLPKKCDMALLSLESRLEMAQTIERFAAMVTERAVHI